jgi:uncharacterized protein GlcG (DUF336 family)
MRKIIFSSALLLGMAVPAFAANTLTERNISLEQANQLTTAAIQACQKDNYNVSVTVVDRAGVIKSVQRMDNAGPHTVKASEMKAYTALTTKNSTGKVMEASQTNAGAQNMRDIPGFLLLAGGLPIKAGDEVIGGIGIGGAPGGHLDQKCAEAALSSVTIK